MWHLAFLLLLAARPAAQIHNPGLLEFDLVFPRNETYAPTQYFPLVLAVRNSSATWPLGMLLKLTIWPDTEEAPPFNSSFFFPNKEVSSGLPPSSPYFFGIAGTNVTNGTTGGFTVLWSVTLEHTCIEAVGLVDPKERQYYSGEFNLRFSTARGAPLPDIEAAVNACPQSTLGLIPQRILKGDCPVIDANSTTPTTTDACGLKSLAKELAANVSTTMLGLMGCTGGTWQSITQPCFPKAKNGGSRWRSGPQTVWMLLIAMVTPVIF